MKGIFKTISGLVLAYKKVTSKNRIFHILSLIENLVITMLQVFKVKPLIFCMPIPVCQIKRLNLDANARVIVLILLLQQ